MTKHSPLIELAKARTNYDHAQMGCIHWDYGCDGDDHPCCKDMKEASVALQRAHQAVKDNQS